MICTGTRTPELAIAAPVMDIFAPIREDFLAP
jgi:hypothetical protein